MTGQEYNNSKGPFKKPSYSCENVATLRILGPSNRRSLKPYIYPGSIYAPQKNRHFWGGSRFVGYMFKPTKHRTGWSHWGVFAHKHIMMLRCFRGSQGMKDEDNSSPHNYINEIKKSLEKGSELVVEKGWCYVLVCFCNKELVWLEVVACFFGA